MRCHSIDVNTIGVAGQCSKCECMYTCRDIGRFPCKVTIIRGVIMVRNDIALQTQENKYPFVFSPKLSSIYQLKLKKRN